MTVVDVSLPSPADVSVAPRFLHRLLRRKLALGCIAYLVLVGLVGLIAPIAMPDVATEQAGDLLHVHEGPSWAHPLGTDTLGRDVLDRLLVGTRPSIVGVAESLVVVLILGVPIGLAAGYFGGTFDRAVSRLNDLAFALPGIIVVLVVMAVFPQSMLAGMVTFGVLSAPWLARIVRSAVLPVKEELYIAAARVSGLSRPYIVSRHVLPRVAGPIIVQASLIAAASLLVQTGLAFLSLLIAPPAPSWGGMVADGVSVIVLQPWLIWPPGIAIAVTILALGLLGDAVRDATTESWSAPARRALPRPAAPSTAPAQRPAEGTLLSVQGLCAGFRSPGGDLRRVVDDVSFEIRRGETLGLVGESGCGKTATALSILGLLPGTGQVEAGHILFEGRDLTALPAKELHRVRGKEIGLISQEPMASLNPSFRVGWLLAEVVRRHHDLSGVEAKAAVVDLLRQVHLPEPELVAARYPHELSGGMAQRVAIARALAGEPKLLIADEPTTALDVTVQAEVLELLRELQAERGMAILLVTHDWGVVADICERAVVMYAGQVVEQGDLEQLVTAPLHPYTDALLAANPHHAPDAAAALPTIPGVVPQPGQWPQGCRFHPRCTYATPECREQAIPLEQVSPRRETRCIHHDLLERDHRRAAART
jgi:peptide/nickel transport system permease protein